MDKIDDTDIKFRRSVSITNWHGILLQKKVLKLLMVGSIVRCIIDYLDELSSGIF